MMTKKHILIILLILLSGKSSPPHVSHNDQETLDFVTKNKNAIGFVAKASDQVKVLTIR